MDSSIALLIATQRIQEDIRRAMDARRAAEAPSRSPRAPRRPSRRLRSDALRAPLHR
jgi:hypothetical protein